MKEKWQTLKNDPKNPYMPIFPEKFELKKKIPVILDPQF